MRASLHLPRGERFYGDALEGLTRVNERLYRESPRLPSIYAGRVRYEPEESEEWRHVVEVLRDGWGDCEDLAAARAGELRSRGETNAQAIVRRTGPKMTHAVVLRANGTIEDPSKRLGMGSRRERIGGMGMARYPGYDSMGALFKRAPVKRLVQAPIKQLPRTPTVVKRDRAPIRVTAKLPATAVALPPVAPEMPYNEPGQEDVYEPDWGDYDDYESDYGPEGNDPDSFELLGADPTPSASLTWTVNRTATGWQGIVRIPLDAGRALLVARSATTKDAATKSAMSAASSVLDSPMAKMLIPPQAQMALNVIRSPQAQKAAKIALEAAKKMKFW